MNFNEIPEDELFRAQQLEKLTIVDSSFGFLDEHNGLRPGRLHLLLGAYGSGKSTLIDDLMLQTCCNGNVLNYKSEEFCKDFIMNIDRKKKGTDFVENIHVESELEHGDGDCVETFKLWFTAKIEALMPSVVFWDNLTTSKWYAEKRSGEQLSFVMWLKGLAVKCNIPIFLVAHTNKNIAEYTQRIIDGNDIRGTASVINLVDYLYILQRIPVGNEYYTTIRIQKHRHHRINNNYWCLRYSKDLNSFTSDAAISFEDFKARYNQRNKL